MRIPALLALSLALPLTALTAQQPTLRGTVRDSVTQRALPGAVVLLLDAAGLTLHRNITDGTGRYAVPLAQGARRLRVQRIGFRPQTVALPAEGLNTPTLDVSLMALPQFLERREVIASGCPRRSDTGLAIALLEQAREGLLAMVVAREENPATLTRVTFERRLDGDDRFDSQLVRLDSTDRSSRSFQSAHSAADFAERGFMESDETGNTLHAPDADVLLDDRFVGAYCFQLARAERARPNELGLRFEPARRERGRVDIDGILWVDTLARAIRGIEFKYVGLDPQVERLIPGGRVSFREMPNGMILVDRWHLRLVGSSLAFATPRRVAAPMSRPRIPTSIGGGGGSSTRPGDRAVGGGGGGVVGGVSGGGGSRAQARVDFFVKENGGEVAVARWGDGDSWRAPLGALRLSARDASGAPAAGVRLRLEGTDYAGTTDSAGSLYLLNLLPGPYRVAAEDARLSEIGLNIPTTGKFEAVRDSTAQLAVNVQTAAEYVSSRCGAGRRALRGDAIPFIAGRIVTSDGLPLGGRPQVNVRRELVPGQWQRVNANFRPGTDGLFFICSDQLRVNTHARIELVRAGHEDVLVPVFLESQITAVRIPVPR